MENENEPTVCCDNCGRDIPESKSFLHEAYCVRNIIRCPKCNEPVDKKEMDEHENESHKLGSCKYCKKDMEKRLLEEHQEACPQKPKMCQFCDCEVSSEEYSQHIYRCGSRTKKCPFCNKNILVRDYDDHEPVCQVTRESYGENFPSIQEEKKETANPYSGLSSKYVATKNPTSNPYESLNQASKPKTKESSTSKHDVQVPSQPKKSSVPEEPKVSSKPELKNPPLTSKTSSSSQRPDSRPDSSSYNYSKPREEKPSVPVTGSTATTSNKYSAATDSRIPSILDSQKPYSYPKEDPNAGYKPYTNPSDVGAYKPGSYGVSATGSRGTTDIHSYNAVTGSYNNPTTQPSTKSYLDNLATRGTQEASSKVTTSYTTGASTGASRSKAGENRPEYGGYGYNAPSTSSTKPQVTSTTTSSTGGKYDPFSKAGLSSINKYSRPEDAHSTAAPSSKVGATEKTYLRGDPLIKANPGVNQPERTKETKPSVPDYGRADDRKPYDYQRGAEPTSYGASRSNQPQYPSSITGVSGSSLNKKYEVNKYEDPTKKASKLTDFNTKPTTYDNRSQASKVDPRGYEKKESISSKTNVPSYSKPSEPSRTRDTGAGAGASQSSKPKKNTPAYDSSIGYGPTGYGNEVYEDEYGVNQDPELQRAIQESLGGISKKKSTGQSTGQSRRNQGDDALVNQSVDDPELQRAIQESLKYQY